MLGLLETWPVYFFKQTGGAWLERSEFRCDLETGRRASTQTNRQGSKEGRKHGALRPQKPLRLIKVVEIGWGGGGA